MIKETKFCGVCKNAGKSESEYTSHYTKSVPGPKGIVVCPTILKNRCNKCDQFGHFSDRCNVVKREVSLPIVTKKVERSSYEDEFPSLSGSKRLRDETVSKDNNQFSILRNHSGLVSKSIVKKPTVSSYKNILKTEAKIVIDEPRFAGQFVELKSSYSTTAYQKHNFDSIDLDMSKRIVPVEIDEEYFDDGDYYCDEVYDHDW
jgi:hypothetical protein